jgi:hypothetical protein
MARAYVENLLTGRWGPDQQILTWWRRELGYDVDKVMVIGGRPGAAAAQHTLKRPVSEEAGRFVLLISC